MKKVWYLTILSVLVILIVAATPSIFISKSTPKSAQGSIISHTKGGWLYGLFIDTSGLTATYTLDLYDHATGVTVMSTRIIPTVVVISGVSTEYTNLWFDPPIPWDSGISTVVTHVGVPRQYQLFYIKR